jgi:hypothetical protein
MKLTEIQAKEIYRRASIGRAALAKGRAMSSTVLAEKMGLCKSTINRIGAGERPATRPHPSRSTDDSVLIRAWCAERKEHLDLAKLHSSSVIAAEYGINKRAVDAIYLGESWPFIPRENPIQS